MPYATVNGIRLFYESHGQGPAILFAHGRGGNHLSWWQQVPFFRERYRCIIIDHREFGLSVEVAGGAGRAAFVEDVRELLDLLEIAQTYLIGQSMGGGTCLGFALANPKRVLGLVLADTSGGIVDDRILEDYRRRAPRIPQAGPERALSSGFRQREPAKAFLYTEIGALTPPVRETFDEYLMSLSGPSAAVVGQLAVPTMVLVGAGDLIVTPENARVVADLIPGARLEIVADAGHSVYFERPDEFNRLCLEFFERCAREH